MALTLSVSYVERNDNKVLTITDTTSNWGIGGNIDVGDVTTMTLAIDITISDGTITSYDTIDLIAFLGLTGASTQADLVIPITPVDLTVAGIPLGTADDVLPDGIWDITYLVESTVPVTSTVLADSSFVQGVVRSEVYSLLRKMNNAYEWDGC